MKVSAQFPRHPLSLIMRINTKSMISSTPNADEKEKALSDISLNGLVMERRIRNLTRMLNISTPYADFTCFILRSLSTVSLTSLLLAFSELRPQERPTVMILGKEVEI